MERLRRAKIVATIGPSSNEVETVVAMARKGMDVARINTSHTDVDELQDLIETVETAREEVGKPLGLMIDMQGQEIRTGEVPEPVAFVAGDEVRFVEGDEVTEDAVGLSIDISHLESGDRILLHDGRIETTVQAVSGGEAVAQVDVGGTLEHRVGVNLPGVDVGADIVTAQDAAYLDIVEGHGVDFVAASFVRDARDVYNVIGAVEARDMEALVVAKVERVAAVDNLAGIVEAADAVMVARGDLGVECPLEEVPTIQKRIIRMARENGKPVITATEMLESMLHGMRPSRAEASDVANAVLDGTDAVMLSGETAIGDHPVHVTEMMARIVSAVERSDEYATVREQHVPGTGAGTTESLARAARRLARGVGAAAIVVESESGYTARKAAKFRPSVPIIAATPEESVARQLMLSWGVSVADAGLDARDTDQFIDEAVAAARGSGLVVEGDTVVVLSGMFRDLEAVRTADLLKIHVIAERIAAGDGIVPGHGIGEAVHLEDGNIDAAPPGAVVVLPETFTGPVEGGFGPLSGIIYEKAGRSNPVVSTAREYGVPLVAGVDPGLVPAGETVTVDAVRGVVYRGSVSRSREG